MLSATPNTAATDRRHNTHLSLIVPDDIEEGSIVRNKRLEQTLQQSWDNVVARFKKETGEDLGDGKSTKNGILGTLKQQYGQDSRDTKKREELMNSVERICNGIEIVSVTAISITSLVFGPAQICYNALDVLLGIPRAVKKYGEDLQFLFQDISSYLSNFKVYDRIDQRGMLDVDLLSSNNDILISLVELCLLAWKIIKSPIKTVLGNVFLKNDAIGEGLSKFRILIEKQNQLTSTMTLEAVLKNESLARQIKQRAARIEDTAKETNVMVRGLAAESYENKNMKIDKDRITKIDRSLELNEMTVSGPIDDLISMRSSLLDETIVVLEKDNSFKDWQNSADQRKLLYIGGESSSGKTNVLSAIAQQIEDRRKKLHARQKEEPDDKQLGHDRSIYLMYYSFSNAEKGSDRGRFDTPAHLALKVMAAQLARQSTRYATTLTQLADKLKGQHTIQQLWEKLKLDDFGAPAKSVMYMFFDSLDQLKSSLPELASVVRGSKQRKIEKNEDEKVKLKVIFTGKLDTSKKLALDKDSLLRISDINKPLIRRYVEERLQDMNIFQDEDDDSEKRRTTVLDLIPQNSNGSFAIARQKLKLLEEAIEEDAEFQAVVEKLQFTTFSTLADEGRKILDRLSSDLSIQHKEQLKELLMWSVYAKRRPDLNELEAALFLQHDRKPLEPLKRKIEGRFDEALEIVPGEVWPRDPIEEVLKAPFDNAPSNSRLERASEVTFTISVDNADERLVRQMFSDLGKNVPGASFEYSSRMDRNTTAANLYFHERDAELIIVARLLRALNDDRVRRQAGPLITYATTFLPAHLETFQISYMEKASLYELESIGKGLINFLWDAVSISSAWNLNAFDAGEWLSEESIRAMTGILEHRQLQEQLDPVQRRWAVQKTGAAAGKAAFLRIMADTAARKWLVDRSHYVDARSCFTFLDKYLDLLPSLTLEASKNATGIENHVQSQNADGVNGDYTKHPLTNGVTVNNTDDAYETEAAGLQNDRNQFAEDEAELYEDDSETASLNGMVEPVVQKQGSEDNEGLLGNFSASSFDVELVKKSLLVAMCYNQQRQPVPSSINLNDCLANVWGKLRWKRNGKAFESASNVQLTGNGKRLEMVLNDGHGKRRWQSIRLDEQISNDDGKLIFLNQEYNESDVADLDDVASEADSVVSDVDRVRRAEKWAVENLKIDLGWFAFTRIGHTLLDINVDTAIETFQKVQSKPQNPWKSVGLSQAYATKEDFEKASESLQEALTIFRSRSKKEVLKKNLKVEKSDYNPTARVEDLFTCLMKAATYQEKLKNELIAIDLLEEALTCRPWASSCRWSLITLLCKANRHTQATSLFDDWRSNFKELGTESPSAFVQRKADITTFQDELMPTVKYSRGTDLYNNLREVFEEAVEETDVSRSAEHNILMLYIQGVVFALDETEEGIRAARQTWKEALNVGHNLDDSCEPLYWCSRRAVMYYFDDALEDLEGLLDQTVPQVNEIADQLKQNLDRLSGPFRSMERKIETPTAHLCAFYRVAGQHDRTKALLRQDMRDAIEILTDENLYNDINGVDILVRVLICYGDYEGAFTAWSLLNRNEMRQKLHAQAKAKPLVEDTVTDSNTVEIEGVDSKSKAAMNKDPESEENANGSAEPEDLNKQMYVWCDDCDEQLDMVEDDAEAWWCTYCPDTVFCGPCMVKVRNDNRREYICSSKHDFVLMKHADYTEEELRGNNVRIEWKWEKMPVSDEEGVHCEPTTKRARSGGRIVDLSEWVEILRNEWEIEENSTEGKIQL